MSDPRDTHYNPPAQPSIRFRLGTQASLFQEMTDEIAKTPGISKLTTRTTSDFSIAFLDSWAMVGDIITFYQERIANENYIRTAQQSKSIDELAAQIGYPPKSGVAASTLLSFEVDAGTDPGGYVTVDAGVKVQSVPGQKQKPQTFETIQQISARADWNKMAAAYPALGQRLRPVDWQNRTLYLKGSTLNLAEGDGLLLCSGKFAAGTASEQWTVVIAQSVTVDRTANLTTLSWSTAYPGNPSLRDVPVGELAIYAFANQAHLFGYNAADWRLMPDQARLQYIVGDLITTAWDLIQLLKQHVAAAGGSAALDDNEALLKALLIKDAVRDALRGLVSLIPDWPDFHLPASGVIDLDQVYDDVTAGTFMFIVNAQALIAEQAPPSGGDTQAESSGGEPGVSTLPQLLAQVQSVASVSRVDYGLSNQVTRIETDADSALFHFLNPDPGRNPYRAFGLRPTIVYCGSQPLAFATETLPDVVPLIGPRITLAKQTLGLAKNRTLIVTGQRIRVEVIAEPPQGFVLVAAGGHLTEPLTMGQSLILLNNPALQASAPLTWLVRTAAGITGIVHARLDDFAVVSMGLPVELKVLANGLQLAGKDGGVALAIGDVVTLWNDPVRNYPYNLIWQLQADSGFIGTIDTLPCWFGLRSAQPNDPPVALATRVKSPPTFKTPTEITLDAMLTNCLDPRTVGILGNVAEGTQGDSVQDVLGSGEALIANQRFKLPQNPLTYLSAPTPTGRRSTLEVYVNDVRWHEVPTLYGQSGQAQVYMVRRGSKGDTWVVFGDGIYGSRLPSGHENVVAKYRNGMSMAGEVPAHSLTMLMTRPLGVKTVDNPLPATGAAGPESGGQGALATAARIRTLDRIVSLADYEDFARTFSGISKAKAVALPGLGGKIVYLTVAAADQQPVTAGTKLYDNLYSAIGTVSVPDQPVVILSYHAITFGVVGTIWIDSRLEAQDVAPAVIAALTDAYSFANARLGEWVTPEQVRGTIMSVAGVKLADIALVPTTASASSSGDAARSSAAAFAAALTDQAAARAGGGGGDGGGSAAEPAVLVTIDANQIYLDSKIYARGRAW